MESKNEFFNVESVSNAFAEAGKTFAKTMNAIIDVFRNAINVITPIYTKAIEKRISKKRFIKLLMGNGIQRNDAQKIAIKYHKNQGFYCLYNVLKEIKNRGDIND